MLYATFKTQATSSDTGNNLQANVCTTEVMGPVLEKYFELYPDD